MTAAQEGAAACPAFGTLTVDQAEESDLPVDVLVRCVRTSGHEGQHLGFMPLPSAPGHMTVRWPDLVTNQEQTAPMTENRYSLDEARQRLAEQECAAHGHSWDVIETMEAPVALVCGTCGQRHDVSR